MKTKENSNLRKNLNNSIEQIKIDYVENKYTQEQLALKYGCSIATMARLLKENNITKNLRIFTQEVIQELRSKIENRIQNEPLNQILKDLKINHAKYKEIMGITNNLTKNIFDESIITLENPLFCYMLGIFISDGHMDSDRIYICQSNASYLHKIQKLIKHQGNINKATSTANPCYKLTLLSSKLRTFLNSYNIASNKKLNAPFIDCGVNNSHFIRGLFDGDGCLYYSYISGKFTNKNLSFSSGSNDVISGIAKFLQNNNIEYQIRTDIKVNTTYTINIEKFESILRLGDLLYKEAGEAFLDRKYYNFIKFKNLVEMHQKVNDIVDASMKVED